MISGFKVGQVVRVSFTDKLLAPSQFFEAKIRAVFSQVAGGLLVYFDVPSIQIQELERSVKITPESCYSPLFGVLAGEFEEVNGGIFNDCYKCTVELVFDGVEARL